MDVAEGLTRNTVSSLKTVTSTDSLFQVLELLVIVVELVLLVVVVVSMPCKEALNKGELLQEGSPLINCAEESSQLDGNISLSCTNFPHTKTHTCMHSFIRLYQTLKPKIQHSCRSDLKVQQQSGLELLVN